MDDYVIPVPLHNQGNQCHFNSFLQAFAPCCALPQDEMALNKADEFTKKIYLLLKYLRKGGMTYGKECNELRLTIYRSLLQFSESKHSKALTTRTIGIPQSASEDFIYFLDMCSQQCPSFQFDKQFQITWKRQLHCGYCHKESLMSPDTNEYISIPSEMSLSTFFEMMSGSPQKTILADYKCSACSHVSPDTFQSVELDKIGSVCCFTLNRVYEQRSEAFHLPTSFTSPLGTFRMVSMIDHRGGMGGGHYLAWLLQQNGNLYLADDAHVRLAHLNIPTHWSIVDPNIYMIFYHVSPS